MIGALYAASGPGNSLLRALRATMIMEFHRQDRCAEIDSLMTRLPLKGDDEGW